MEALSAVLVGFPFISALFLALIKNNNARKIITYSSCAVLVLSALAFSVTYFVKGAGVVELNEGAVLFNKNVTELVELITKAGEVLLVVLITVLSVKYKKYYAALLAIAQSVLVFVYEFKGEHEYKASYFYVDELSVIMVLIIAIVGSLITVYACGYMVDYHNHHKDINDRRRFFFAAMYIFLGAMFALVLSNNLLWLYFFWEVTSVCSFLMISYTKTKEAVDNSFKALWMNLLGGLFMAVGIVILGVKFETFDLETLIKSNGGLIVFAVSCFSIAALTKSAQLPFSKWLLGAMVAPTPSSALLHSATMVKAGVYLLIRLAPVLSGQLSGNMVSLVGGLTFLGMSMLAITVSDGKKVLAYSTLSNLGLITACAGVGTQETIWAAIFLVIFHAVSKSLLFQTVGSVEHQTGSRDIEDMHGLVRRYPYLTWMLVIGISGMFLAPFGMLVSKWAALKAFVDNGSILLVLCICFGSSTTLLYWAKWLATILASKPNDVKHKNTNSINQWISLIAHSVLMVLICFIFPIISKHVILPYTSRVFYGASQVLPKEDIILMIVLILFVFVVPTLTYFLIAKNRPFPKADRYFNGAGTPDNVGFIDSFGEEKREYLTNWYLVDIFDESKMYLPCVIISIVLIAGFTVASIVFGGGALW